MSTRIVYRLPSALIVGPQRTATTWIHRFLRGHAALPRGKETDFFNLNYARGLSWYTSQFEPGPDDAPAVEVCPNYFAGADAIDRIAALLPACRIVCILRDPVERAWSHYRLLRSRGMAGADFEREATTPGSPIHEAGRYAHYLARWFERFGRERVAILVYETLAANPERFIQRLCDAIGIAPIALENPLRDLALVNRATHEARRPRLARGALLATRWLERGAGRPLKRVAAKLGIWRACYAPGRPFAPLSRELVERMNAFYRPEMEALERLLADAPSADVPWRGPAAADVPWRNALSA